MSARLLAVSRLFLDDLDDQFVHSGDEIDHDDDDFEVLSWLGASQLCIATIATVPTSLPGSLSATSHGDSQGGLFSLFL